MKTRSRTPRAFSSGRRRRGISLIEVMIAATMSVVISAGLWNLIRSTFDSQYLILNQNAANADARRAMDELADRVRGAQIPSGNTSALLTANNTEISFYDYADQYDSTQSHTLVAVRYWFANGQLLRTVNNLPTTGSVIVSNVQSLSITYYQLVSGSWVSASSYADPTPVSAVLFVVNVSENGSSRQITSKVQIRQKRITG